MPDMKEYLLKLDKQIEEGLEIGKEFFLSKPSINKILFSAMGGSAISGDILRMLVSRNLFLPFEVHRSPNLPRWVDSKTLVIFSSFSGNTREVLSALRDALKVKAKILTVTAGGELGDIAAKKKLPCIYIPDGLPPRCAVGYLTFSLIPLLKRWGWAHVSDKDVHETLDAIRHLNHAEAKKLAKLMLGRSIHLYGIAGFAEPILRRWRGQLAENAKILASHHFIPEMFHNEVEAWGGGAGSGKNCFAAFFRDRQEPSWLEPKIRAVRRIIRASGAGEIEIHSRGNSLLARLFSLLYLGDWVSYEMSVLKGVDPLNIQVIDQLKKIK